MRKSEKLVFGTCYSEMCFDNNCTATLSPRDLLTQIFSHFLMSDCQKLKIDLHGRYVAENLKKFVRVLIVIILI